MLTLILVPVATALIMSLIGASVKAATVAAAGTAISNLLSIDNISNIRGFDEPYQKIATQAIQMLTNFMDYAQTLIILCAFLCIVFNSFKLWAGAVEIKKAYVDMVTKTVMCTALMLIYPQVVMETFNLATKLGVEASGGYNAVMTSFSNLAKKTRDIWDEGTAEFLNVMTSGGERDADGKIILSKKLLKTFVDAGMTEEEAVQWAAQHNMTVGETSAAGIWWWKNEQQKTEIAARKLMKNEDNVKMMRQCLSIVHALSEVLTGTQDSALADGRISATELMNMGDKTLENIFYNPYIENTSILSSGTMIKTAIIISEIAAAGAVAPFDNSMNGADEEGASFNDMMESKNTNVLVKFLGAFFKSFIYKVLMVISMILIMCEYILCIIEYFIVMAVSALLIPLFFIDATKNFATNILKTIFAYFMKILVTTMMCFFVVSMYINLGRDMCTKTDLGAMSTILLYAFTIFLGVILVKNSGKIAGAAISGNPSLGLGDLAHEMHSMGHAMHSIGHTVGGALDKGVKTAGAAVQGGVRTGMAAKATLDSARAAKRSTGTELSAAAAGGESAQYSGKTSDIKAAAKDVEKKTVGAAAKQNFGDAAFKALTGTDRQHLDNNGQENGFLQIGQEFMDQGNVRRKATFADVKAAADRIAKSNGKSVYDDAIKKHGRKPDRDFPMPEPE